MQSSTKVQRIKATKPSKHADHYEGRASKSTRTSKRKGYNKGSSNKRKYNNDDPRTMQNRSNTTTNLNY